jgi:hypothetical protein
LRHSSAFPTAAYTGTPSVSTGGGYTIYVFNGDGSITWT